MNILVTGPRGQLGRSLVAAAQAAGHTVHAPALDLRDHDAVEDALRHTSIDVAINAAAYTAVDRAEGEHADAYAVNRDAAGNLARACAHHRIRMLHVSTDYVFDGAATAPYAEDAAVSPLGVYGASKAAGEMLVHGAGGTVVRTSWLFSDAGPSFVQSILALARAHPVLRVVADQHGCPTYAPDLADALLALAAHAHLAPTYHFCNDGPTSRHAFATAIVEAARAHEHLACTRIEAITTADLPRPAKRPRYAVLATDRIRAAGIVPGGWDAGLARAVQYSSGAAGG